MNSRKSPIILSATLLTFCFFALGCNLGGGNTNNTTNNTTSNTTSSTNNTTSNTNNQSSAGNSSSPATSGSPAGTPQPLPDALTGGSSWVQTAGHPRVRGQIGQRFTYTCPPNTRIYDEVRVAGDVYYTGSSLCTAAFHAGVITQAQGGQVTIEIRPAPVTTYTAGEERNGVTPKALSFNNQADNGGFVFVRP